MEFDEVVRDDEDRVLHPTIAPGAGPREWPSAALLAL